MADKFPRRILHVDLSQGRLEVEKPSNAFYRKYMGGSAMGLYYIPQSVRGPIHSLGPENVLTLMVSVLTGAPISGQSRMTACAVSPLVEGIGDSQCGGFFPAEMRFAGFDGIVISGKSPKPVYLWLHDGEAELHPADHLWGKTTAEVSDLLKAELGDDKIEIAQCGPAGEKLVRLAAIINMDESRQWPHRHGRRNDRKEPQGCRGAWEQQTPAVGGARQHQRARQSRRRRGPRRRQRPRFARLRHSWRGVFPALDRLAADLQLQRRAIRRLRGHFRRAHERHRPQR